MGYDAEWALIMVLIFDAIGLIVGMFIIKTLMPFSIRSYFKKVIIPIIPTIIISLIIELLLHSFIANGYLRFGLVLVIGTIVTFITFYFIGVSTEEKRLLLDLANGFLKHLKPVKK